MAVAAATLGHHGKVRGDWGTLWACKIGTALTHCGLGRGLVSELLPQRLAWLPPPPTRGEVGSYLGLGQGALCSSAPCLPGLARPGATLERHHVPTWRELLAERLGLPLWASGAPAAVTAQCQGPLLGPSILHRILSPASSCDTFPSIAFLMP